PRDVMAGGRGLCDLIDDLVERHWCRIDDACARRAVFEQGLGDQRTGIETHRAARDQVAPAQSDQIRRARAGADEVHRHPPFSAGKAPSPSAKAQVADALAMRGRISRAWRPAATSAAVSAMDGTPFNRCTRSL